jgi:transcriptional regulator with XRE-family HTH domain
MTLDLGIKSTPVREQKSLDVGVPCGNMQTMDGTIKRLRVRRGLTQVELAKRAGIARGYLAQLEAGHKRAPSVAVLEKLARALRVNIGTLLRKGK